MMDEFMHLYMNWYIHSDFCDRAKEYKWNHQERARYDHGSIWAGKQDYPIFYRNQSTLI